MYPNLRPGRITQTKVEVNIKFFKHYKFFEVGFVEKGRKIKYLYFMHGGMAKFTEYVNNNPDYFDYLKNRVIGNIEIESLSNEEIEAIKNQEQIEQKELQELEKNIDVALIESNDAEA